MYILTNQKNPKVCDSPIRCMKVVHRNGNSYEPLFYRFNDIIYRIGETAWINVEEMKKFMKPIRGDIYGGLNSVNCGFHTYTYGNENGITLFRNLGTEKYALLECEIPEGALYYEGYSHVRYSPFQQVLLTATSYCSNMLRVVMEVPLSDLVEKFNSSI